MLTARMTQVGDIVDVTEIDPDPEKRPLGLVAARPLVWVAVALILGIALGKHFAIPVPLGIGVGAVGVGLAVLLRRSALIASASICLSAIGLGMALVVLSSTYYPSDHVSHFTTETRRLSQIQMRIMNPPRIYAPTFGQAHPMPAKQVAIARVTGVLTTSGWQDASGEILVQISEPHPRLRVGQTVRAWGMIDRPAPAMNPGQFDWAAYYRQQRVLASIHIPHATNIVITDESNAPLLERWRAWTRNTLAEGFTEQQSLDHALLRALVLGDSDPELRDVQEQFRKTGTSHHLAISGMHIAVMGGVVFLVARLFRLSPRHAWWAAMIFVSLYGIAALPSAPVVRSVLLWLAIGVAILARRATDLLQLLALVVIAMLLYHPLDLFNAGFQLSFGIVLGLILLTRPMSHLFGMHKRDVSEHAPTRWILRAAAYIDSRIILVISAGVVAWLVSMPVIASHFTQLNPWAIGASILIAPVVFLALIGGMLKILLTAAFPSLAWLWADLAQFPSLAMRRSVDWLSTLPYGDVPLPPPAWWMIGLFYVTLVLAAVGWSTASARVLARIAHALAIFVLLWMPYRSTITHTASGQSLRVTLLSVGAGQCAVVEPPSGRIVLLDAGSLSLADPVRRAIAPFLRQRGITQIDLITVSHANSDHFSAVGELVEAYGVREIMVAPNFIDSATDNPMLGETLAQLHRNQRPPTTVTPGHVIPLGNQTSIQVLWPPASAAGLEANDQSLVLMLEHAGTRILFTGDIENDAMRALLKHPDAIRADVLIAPHHGSFESETAAFVEAVGARHVIASNDRTLTGKQQKFDRLIGTQPLYRTHSSGAVTIEVDASGQYTLTPHLSQ